jgi:hypothetical protein
MKPRNMARMAISLALLIAVCVIVSPVSATYTITGDIPGIPILNEAVKDYYTNVQTLSFATNTTGHAINLIHFKVPTGNYVNFSLHYGTGQTVSGSAENHLTSVIPPTTLAYINFNGETQQYSYWDTNPEFDYNLAGYAREDSTNTSGFIVYHAGYGGFDDNLAVFMPVSNIGTNLIYAVELSGSAPFDVDISHAEYASVSQGVSKTAWEAAGDWLNFGLQILTFVYDMVLSLFYWTKFFFVDNLVMTIALYLTLTMAFAARASRGNIAKFLRIWFKDQVGLMRFIFELWRMLIETIGSVRGWFRL